MDEGGQRYRIRRFQLRCPAVITMNSKSLCWTALPIIVTVFAHSWGAEPKWHSVRGHDLQTLFSGREFGDGVHFAYQFRANGAFAGTEMGKSVQGRWRATLNQFCWSWIKPPGAEECYDVQSSGKEIRLMRFGSEQFTGTLSPAKAEDRRPKGE